MPSKLQFLRNSAIFGLLLGLTLVPAGARAQDSGARRLANIVSVAVSEYAMAGFGGSLSAQQRWDVINYIYTLRGEKMVLPLNDAKPTSPAAVSASILALLDSARSLAGSGNISAARDGAFDAYLAFEPLESIVSAKDPGLVTSLERSFANFKIAVASGDAESARLT